jgi:hypothetical protein
MNERQWELYRLSVVETWSESPYKRAVSAAIEHKLMVLALALRIAGKDTPRLRNQPARVPGASDGRER